MVCATLRAWSLRVWCAHGLLTGLLCSLNGPSAAVQAQEQDPSSARAPGTADPDPVKSGPAQPEPTKKALGQAQLQVVQADPALEPAGPAIYSARATVKEPAAVARESELLAQEVPGTMGDPFRILESMPGAVPMVSGLPYVYVRGAPPSGNGYYYDGIPLPQLFHLGLGPAVLHPTVLGDLEFDPGVSAARYGRRLGAVLRAEGAPAPSRPRALIDARLLDFNGMVALPVGERGHVIAAGRVGDPDLTLALLGVNMRSSFWDYQLRARMPVGERDYAELVALGSRDVVGDAQAIGAAIGYADTGVAQRIELEFHRLEVRLVRELRRTTFGMALRAGYDASEAGPDIAARAYTLSPRLWYRHRFVGGHRLEVGADVLAASGRTREVPRSVTFVDSAVNAVSRNTLGVYADGEVRLASAFRLELGLRSDLWIIGASSEVSLDPRLRLRWLLTDALELFVGAGLTHQPVVFAFPLPGFTEAALDRGLQEGAQSELGAAVDLPWDLRLEASLFLHHYTDLLLPEIYLRALGVGNDRVTATSYGGELFLSRSPKHAVSGFISYTLGFAKAVEPFEQRSFEPEFDIRHVLNAVLQWRFWERLTLSSALRLRTGKPANQFTDEGVPPYYTLRLPGFMRLDSRVSYGFRFMDADFDAYVEMLNVTLAREVVDAECFFGNCRPVAEQPIFFPNLGLRARF